ncbi:MAG TPA: nitrous oxide reductase accessory protein NosL [Blastocatellia bacterium]|nr:nitrous oxide reductase accessory protein NosL [Blastocatellia bacterium]
MFTVIYNVKTRYLVLPRLFTFAFLFLPFAFTACGPSRAAVVSADATAGYCAVCKMQVKRDEAWAAEIYYSDGKKMIFKSPAHLLEFYLAPAKFEAPDAQKDRANITRIVVKDYQTGKPIDARAASFVMNSKVEGEMGPDFVPFDSRQAAEKFVRENRGSIVTLNEVTLDMVQSLRKK